MDERPSPDHEPRDATDNPGRATRSAEPDDQSEGSASSAHKYRRLDRDGARAPTAAEQSHRFLFVDSSSASQRPRSDQRAINAHIQQNAYRNRRQAAQKQTDTGAANVGRHRREAQLQPRPIEPHPSIEPQQAPATSIRPTTTSKRAAASRISNLSPRPSTGANIEDQVHRLRHYSNIRGPEVRQAVEAQREDERRAAGDSRRSATPDDDRALVQSTSMRSMLTQILQRLDAGNVGQALGGPSLASLRNSVLDPFNPSSVTITPAMNAVLRHCKPARLLCRTHNSDIF
jgi:hypothetical protein